VLFGLPYFHILNEDESSGLRTPAAAEHFGHEKY
jgi:hypothetical protein